jgi:hypothetical protein
MSLREHALMPGRYRVERQIADGTGAVWPGTNQQAGREVPLNRASGPGTRNEHGRRNHPHIVELFDVVERAGW